MLTRYIGLHGNGGYYDQIKAQLDKGESPNSIEEDTGYSALQLAIQYNEVDVVELLLQCGADSNLGGVDTPLNEAIENYAHHLDLFEEDSSEKQAFNNAKKIIDLLIQHGVNVNGQYLRSWVINDGIRTDYYDDSALHNAVKVNHIPLLTTLLNAGANPILKNDLSNETPLSLAEQNGQVEVAALLKQYLQDSTPTPAISTTDSTLFNQAPTKQEPATQTKHHAMQGPQP